MFPNLRTVSLMASLLRPLWAACVLAVLSAAGAALAGFGLLTTSAWLLCTASYHPSIAVLQTAVVGVRFFGLARGVLRYLERLATHHATFRVLSELRSQIYAQVASRTPQLFDRLGSGELLGRIVLDVGVLENLFTRLLLPPLVCGIVLIALTAVSVPVSLSIPRDTLLCIALFHILIPAWLVVGSRGKRLPGLQAALLQSAGEASAARWELLAYGATDAQLGRVMKEEEQFSAAHARWSQRLSALPASHHAGQASAVFLALWHAAQAVSQGCSPVTASVAVIGALVAFEAAEPLGTAILHLIRCLRALQRIDDLADTERTPPAPRIVSADLHAEDLHFRYEGAPREVLGGVSLSMSLQGNPPQRLQLAGASGSGKSTLLSLLIGTRAPVHGRISSPEPAVGDGHAVMSLASRRDHIFATTLRENLLLAAPSASNAEVEAALRTAGLQTFVQALPQGIDTPLGEFGQGLSGGERQRLILARALLTRPRLLILDEIFAELDPATAQEVASSLAELQLPLLCASHQLLPELCDGILYLEKGIIEEQGEFRVAIAGNGPVSLTWQLQRDKNIEL